MIREFLVLSTLLVVLVGAMVWHYILYSGDSGAIDDISCLTTMTTPSLSVAFYEPRELYGDRHEVYPSIPTISRVGFVYVK